MPGTYLTTAHWTAELYQAIDSKDTRRFLSFLTDDARFQYGNHTPAIGSVAIGTAVDGFFSSIRASHHDILNNWEPQGHLISQGMVSYTRLDGGTVTLPFVNVFAMRDKLVRDYMIYVDATPLYAPAI
ncbi:MAG: nuclear transport factor 2 family protein [Betaproteobacteria bacterium]